MIVAETATERYYRWALTYISLTITVMLGLVLWQIRDGAADLRQARRQVEALQDETRDNRDVIDDLDSAVEALREQLIREGIEPTPVPSRSPQPGPTRTVTQPATASPAPSRTASPRPTPSRTPRPTPSPTRSCPVPQIPIC